MVIKYLQLSSFLKVQKALMINHASENLPTRRKILVNVKSIHKTAFWLCGSLFGIRLTSKPHTKYMNIMYLNQLIMRKGLDMLLWIGCSCSHPPEALTMMIVFDEAWFYLTLPINKQKDRTWNQEKPLEYIERPQKI